MRGEVASRANFDIKHGSESYVRVQLEPRTSFYPARNAPKATQTVNYIAYQPLAAFLAEDGKNKIWSVNELRQGTNSILLDDDDQCVAWPA
jgi:hypothetical protein